MPSINGVGRNRVDWHSTSARSWVHYTVCGIGALLLVGLPLLAALEISLIHHFGLSASLIERLGSSVHELPRLVPDLLIALATVVAGFIAITLIWYRRNLLSGLCHFFDYVWSGIGDQADSLEPGGAAGRAALAVIASILCLLLLGAVMPDLADLPDPPANTGKPANAGKKEGIPGTDPAPRPEHVKPSSDRLDELTKAINRLAAQQASLTAMAGSLRDMAEEAKVNAGLPGSVERIGITSDRQTDYLAAMTQDQASLAKSAAAVAEAVQRLAAQSPAVDGNLAAIVGDIRDELVAINDRLPAVRPLPDVCTRPLLGNLKWLTGAHYGLVNQWNLEFDRGRPDLAESQKGTLRWILNLIPQDASIAIEGQAGGRDDVAGQGDRQALQELAKQRADAVATMISQSRPHVRFVGSHTDVVINGAYEPALHVARVSLLQACH